MQEELIKKLKKEIKKINDSQDFIGELLTEYIDNI